MSGKLPVHGFVLAGGKSSRMGTDKALLEFGGRPLVEIAVEKLSGFCAQVSIAGNRDDLSRFAPVVHEDRLDCGPAAGIEAGLRASQQEWAMFIPVDVPLVPEELLRRWAEETVALGKASFLLSSKGREPAFCVMQRDCRARVSAALDIGLRRLDDVLLTSEGVEERSLTRYAAREQSELEVQAWFTNVNTPEDLAQAPGWGETLE